MGYRHFQIGCIFAEYDLFKHIISITKLYVFDFLYKLDTILYQFLKTGTSDITFKGSDQELK